MKRLYSIMALVLVCVGMSACSSQCENRSTASSDDVQVYKPAIGEVHHAE